MDNNVKTCPKDCMKCPPSQWMLCAAQMSQIALDRIDELQDRFEKTEDKIKKLIHADEVVFNPMENATK